MRDERLNATLEALVPAPPAEQGWDDVLVRARKLRRTRRRRTAVAAAAASGLALLASLTAAGQIASLVLRSNEPHLLLRGELRGPDGERLGSLEIELHRAGVVLGRRVELLRWPPPHAPARLTARRTYPARWFVDLDVPGSPGQGVLRFRSAAGSRARVVVLCARCSSEDSGRIELSWTEASALVNDRATFTLSTPSGGRPIAGAVELDRSHLTPGVRCVRSRLKTRLCTRIYTGRV